MELSFFHSLVANPLNEHQYALLHFLALTMTLRDFGLDFLQHVSQHFIKLGFGVAELLGKLRKFGLHLLIFG